jgi:hypothetical protein
MPFNTIFQILAPILSFLSLASCCAVPSQSSRLRGINLDRSSCTSSQLLVLESALPFLEQYVEASLDQIDTNSAGEPFTSFFQPTAAPSIREVFIKVNESLRAAEDMSTIRCVEGDNCQSSKGKVVSPACCDQQDSESGFTLNLSSSVFDNVSWYP